MLFNNHIISYKLQFLTSANEMSLKSIGLKSIVATNQQRWSAQESGGRFPGTNNTYPYLQANSKYRLFICHVD